MTTQISTKIGAFVAALMMNTLILGSVAYLFNGRAQAQVEQASTSAPTACSTLAVV
jgi:hypothetical protein